MTNTPKNCWVSPLNECDICSKPFGDGEGESSVMADASLGGCWGNFCDDCIVEHSITYGLGIGQKYEIQEIDGTKWWVKVEG